MNYSNEVEISPDEIEIFTKNECKNIQQGTAELSCYSDGTETYGSIDSLHC